MYDEATTAAWLRDQAALADQEYLEARPAEVDPILARSCVFGCLHDRYFLESRELLVNELRWLRKNGKPGAPQHARSVEAYDSARDALLDELISRFDPDQSTST